MGRRKPGKLSLIENESLRPVVELGRNCWRIEHADRVAVVVDAADYYHLVRTMMEQAERRILIIGWDFDTRICLEPGAKGRGEKLGRFMLRLARERPSRDILILKWRFGALKQLLHFAHIRMLWKWWRTRAIEFRFDGHHPAGCSHHQKIVVIDDCLAVCGGIDITSRRWDTPSHADDDPHRFTPAHRPYLPWHDATMMLDGAAATAIGDLARHRWQVATGRELDRIPQCPPLWPEELTPDFHHVDIAIARTVACYRGQQQVREIEEMSLDLIAAARRFIYIENQYLTSGRIAGAIARRMAEPDPIEIVVVMPRNADGWLEQRAMDAARIRLARTIGRSDPLDRFRIYVPVTADGTDIYVHAKIAIVDDRLLRVGSSNLNNRSLGLDSECDLVIDAALPANRGSRAAIAALRNRLLAEHLGVTADCFAAAFERHDSLVAAIEELRGNGKTLELLDLEKPGPLDKFIADHELLDPLDDFLEPIGKRGLWKSWREGLRFGARSRRMARRSANVAG